MKKETENKSVSVNVRYTFSEWKFLVKKAKEAKLFRGKHNKIPCVSDYVRSKTLV